MTCCSLLYKCQKNGLFAQNQLNDLFTSTFAFANNLPKLQSGTRHQQRREYFKVCNLQYPRHVFIISPQDRSVSFATFYLLHNRFAAFEIDIYNSVYFFTTPGIP